MSLRSTVSPKYLGVANLGMVSPFRETGWHSPQRESESGLCKFFCVHYEVPALHPRAYRIQLILDDGCGCDSRRDESAGQSKDTALCYSGSNRNRRAY